MKAEKQSITSSLSTTNFHKIAESNNSSQTISMKTTERGKDVVGSGMIVKVQQLLARVHWTGLKSFRETAHQG